MSLEKIRAKQCAGCLAELGFSSGDGGPVSHACSISLSVNISPMRANSRVGLPSPLLCLRPAPHQESVKSSPRARAEYWNRAPPGGLPQKSPALWSPEVERAQARAARADEMLRMSARRRQLENHSAFLAAADSLSPVRSAGYNAACSGQHSRRHDAVLYGARSVAGNMSRCEEEDRLLEEMGRLRDRLRLRLLHSGREHPVEPACVPDAVEMKQAFSPGREETPPRDGALWGEDGLPTSAVQSVTPRLEGLGQLLGLSGEAAQRQSQGVQGDCTARPEEVLHRGGTEGIARQPEGVLNTTFSVDGSVVEQAPESVEAGGSVDETGGNASPAPVGGKIGGPVARQEGSGEKHEEQEEGPQGEGRCKSLNREQRDKGQPEVPTGDTTKGTKPGLNDGDTEGDTTEGDNKHNAGYTEGATVGDKKKGHNAGDNTGDTERHTTEGNNVQGHNAGDANGEAESGDGHNKGKAPGTKGTKKGEKRSGKKGDHNTFPRDEETDDKRQARRKRSRNEGGSGEESTASRKGGGIRWDNNLDESEDSSAPCPPPFEQIEEDRRLTRSASARNNVVTYSDVVSSVGSSNGSSGRTKIHWDKLKGQTLNKNSIFSKSLADLAESSQDFRELLKKDMALRVSDGALQQKITSAWLEVKQQEHAGVGDGEDGVSATSAAEPADSSIDSGGGGNERDPDVRDSDSIRSDDDGGASSRYSSDYPTYSYGSNVSSYHYSYS